VDQEYSKWKRENKNQKNVTHAGVISLNNNAQSGLSTVTDNKPIK